MTDYYHLLEVSRDADADAIKRAYRKLAVKYHPDRNPNDAEAEQRFKQINEAYNVLNDPQKRARYDRFGARGMGGNGGRGGFNPNDFGSVGEIFESIFGDIWGQGSARARPGRDIQYELSLSFEEAARGVEKSISYQRGTADGGSQRMQMQVKVPVGVDDGAVRTIAGGGEEGPGGPGDLHVIIRVQPHDFFERKGADIRCVLPISYPQAVLGASISVPTLDGQVTMRIPAGTPSGKVLRLRGKGLPVFGGYGKGDQLVRVFVEIPQQLSPRQRELIEDLGNELNVSNLPQQPSLWNKFKDWLQG